MNNRAFICGTPRLNIVIYDHLIFTFGLYVCRILLLRHSWGTSAPFETETNCVSQKHAHVTLSLGTSKMPHTDYSSTLRMLASHLRPLLLI